MDECGDLLYIIVFPFFPESFGTFLAFGELIRHACTFFGPQELVPTSMFRLDLFGEKRRHCASYDRAGGVGMVEVENDIRGRGGVQERGG